MEPLEGLAPPTRKIIHIDMDAFYASVEQRDNPELRGKPVAVGGVKERGVVAAASYEARVFGVHSAMPSVTARRKCPELIFVKPRFETYRAVSEQIHEIFADYTSLIEPLSLDEAYLDITENFKAIPLATDVAREIREKIFNVTGLTASAGISYNKFLAKMASSQRKPNGQYSIPPGKGEQFVENLRIGKFHGVGPATEKKMNRLEIFSGADLKAKPLDFMQYHFGKAGLHFYMIARALDNRRVTPDRERKSVGAETTFTTDLTSLEDAREALHLLAEKVSRHCQNKGLQGRTITIKIKYNDFEQITRSRSIPGPIDRVKEITEVVELILPSVFPAIKPMRLLGVTLSSFDEKKLWSNQMTLSI